MGSEEWKNYVILLIDEIKVRERLVYDKYDNRVVGFVELDDIEHALSQLKEQNESYMPPVATHLLTLMVRGFFTSLKFPYTHFPTADVTGNQIVPVVWEAIECLERRKFKVVAITSDGASCNRRFIHLHCSG